MSSPFLKEVGEDVFYESPAGVGFLDAAYFALSHYGDVRIPHDTLLDLQAKYKLTDREVPAFTYLAQVRLGIDRIEI